MIKPSDMEILLAKRSHPELNKKEELESILRQYKDDPDIYCSFSNVKKLGINPKTKWSNFAPVAGIWSYPINYLNSQIVLDINDNLNNNKKIDIQSQVFGSDMKYLFIIKDKHLGRHINDLEYTKEELDKDLETIKKYFKKYNITVTDRVINYNLMHGTFSRSNTNFSGLLRSIKEYCHSTFHVSKVLMEALNIYSISWTNNQLHCDIKEETVWLSNKAIEIIDIINNYNGKKYDKLFILPDDLDDWDDSYWNRFINYINVHPEEYKDILNNKKLLIQEYKNWSRQFYDLDEYGHGDGWY